MTEPADTADDRRVRRVSISFDAPAAASEATRTHGIALPGAPVREADSVFLNDLMRAQLRLACACLIGFVLLSLMLTAAILLTAGTGDPVVFGVPLSWLLQAYGYYPIILFFAIVFARNASRNERRFRSLAGVDGEKERSSA